MPYFSANWITDIYSIFLSIGKFYHHSCCKDTQFCRYRQEKNNLFPFLLVCFRNLSWHYSLIFFDWPPIALRYSPIDVRLTFDWCSVGLPLVFHWSSIVLRSTSHRSSAPLPFPSHPRNGRTMGEQWENNGRTMGEWLENDRRYIEGSSEVEGASSQFFSLFLGSYFFFLIFAIESNGQIQ